MRKLSALVALAGMILSAGVVHSANATKTTYDKIVVQLDAQNIRGSLTEVIKSRTKKPRYFESDCEPELKTDNPLYPGIPYKECRYKLGTLHGWVQLAVIPPDMISRWITSACEKSGKPLRCVARIAAYMWDSNQFSYPIAGNIIEAAKSAGGTGDGYLNLSFLHGVTIPLPEGFPQRGAISVSDQEKSFRLLATQNTVERPSQVSRPSGIRREIYLDYAEPMKSKDGAVLDVGKSCPVSARKDDWLEVSRLSLVEAWKNPTHRLVSAAAIALEKDAYPGRITCK